jgi:hypothetical protein
MAAVRFRIPAQPRGEFGKGSDPGQVGVDLSEDLCASIEAGRPVLGRSTSARDVCDGIPVAKRRIPI